MPPRKNRILKSAYKLWYNGQKSVDAHSKNNLLVGSEICSIGVDSHSCHAHLVRRLVTAKAHPGEKKKVPIARDSFSPQKKCN
jgi:hypothetical protein